MPPDAPPWHGSFPVDSLAPRRKAMYIHTMKYCAEPGCFTAIDEPRVLCDRCTVVKAADVIICIAGKVVRPENATLDEARAIVRAADAFRCPA